MHKINVMAFAGMAAVLACVGAPQRALAVADQTTTASASATVNTIFSVALDVSTIPFGSVDPGSQTDLTSQNVATCKSNNGSIWYLKIKYDAAEADATFSFKSSGGGGTNVTVFTALTTINQTTYTSTAGEGNNLAAGTAITLDYRLDIAAAASPGAKAWTVTYTLTETV